jgi:hypothetical protein
MTGQEPYELATFFVAIKPFPFLSAQGAYNHTAKGQDTFHIYFGLRYRQLN